MKRKFSEALGEDENPPLTPITSRIDNNSSRMGYLNESLISGTTMETPPSSSKDSSKQYSHHNGSWGIYIGNKRRKIESQFGEKFVQHSGLFQNCVIWINGRTRV